MRQEIYEHLEGLEAPDAPFSVWHLRRLKPYDVVRQRGRRRLVVPQIYELRGSAFELCADEERFVKRLLGRPSRRGLNMRNLWVYRGDQRRPAGDFVIVDCAGGMGWSGGRVMPQWEVFVVELKMNTRLHLGGGGTGNQLLLAEPAAECALRLTWCLQEGPLGAEPLEQLSPRRLWKVVGSRERVLDFFRLLPLLRGHRRKYRTHGRALVPLYRELRQSLPGVR